MNPKTITSYLVSLGFHISPTQLQNFQNTLKNVKAQATQVATAMAKDFVAAGVAITGTLLSVSGATLALINNVSQADLGYQIFARRMFMSVDAAKKLKIATDALGYSLEDVIWGPPELRERYMQLIRDQRGMEGGLGGDFETQMRGLRDVRFEFTRLRVELQYLAMGTVSSISQLMFGDKDALLIKLRQLNDWLIRSLPQLARGIATYVVPVMKDMWRIGVDLWNIFEKFTSVVFRLMGILYGDQSLMRGTVNFQNFGLAADHVANSLARVFDMLSSVVNFIESHPKTVGAVIGGAVGMRFGGLEGALIGAPIGALGGALYQYKTGQASKAGGVAAQAAVEAKRIAPSLGIPASVLLSQWAHETNDFNDYKADTFHNLGGVRDSSGHYRSFSSFDDFGDFIAKLYTSKRYGRVPGSQTTDALAAALKAGGYYEDSYANYSAGMRRDLPYASGLLNGPMNVDVGGIVINQPNATQEQIQAAVTRGIKDSVENQNKRNLVQFNGPYN